MITLSAIFNKIKGLLTGKLREPYKWRMIDRPGHGVKSITTYANGDKEWQMEGMRHRKGVAVEYLNGNKTWWFDGKSYRSKN